MKFRFFSRHAASSFFVHAGMGGCLIAVILLFFLTQPVLLQQLNLKIYDHFLTRIADGNITPAPFIVDIDERSLEHYGQWPWPRYRLALLVQRLLDAGVAAVGLDIVLAEADRTSPVLLRQAFQQELGLDFDFKGLPEDLRDNDILLGRGIKGKPVVLGAYMRFVHDEIGQNPQSASRETVASAPGLAVVERSAANARPALDGLSPGTGMIQPVPALVESAPVGFFNMGLDQDGLVRRVPLLLRYEERVYASLALRSLMAALDTNTVRLQSGADGLERLGVGSYSFPVDPDGSMLVPYRGAARTFPYVSAQDVLEGKLDPEFLRGRIAFIGTSAAGLLDIRSTPLDRYTPGVEVHATVLDAILSGRSLQIPPWDVGLQILLILFLGTLALILFSTLSPGLALGTCALLLTALYLGSERLFAQGSFVTPLWGMLTVSAESAGLAALRLWRAERDKRQIRSIFGRYVSPEIVSRIVESGDNSNALLRGEERELTIMFTDLRGFTSLSEQLSPEQVVRLLNAYFTPMTALVRQSRGTLDKFIGDALMAFWNAPLDVPEHPARAVEVALAMQDTLKTLNISLEQEFGVRLSMGAGLHTGMAHVGNMGSLDLTSYTALGDAVNLASRLESLSARFGVPLVLSGESRARCPDTLFFLPLARLRVKGRKQAVDIFTAMRHAEAKERAEELEQYLHARALYQQALVAHDVAAMQRVCALFAALVHGWPERKFYAEYMAHCQKLAGNTADAAKVQNSVTDSPQILDDVEWSDIWTLTNK